MKCIPSILIQTAESTWQRYCAAVNFEKAGLNSCTLYAITVGTRFAVWHPAAYATSLINQCSGAKHVEQLLEQQSPLQP